MANIGIYGIFLVFLTTHICTVSPEQIIAGGSHQAFVYNTTDAYIYTTVPVSQEYNSSQVTVAPDEYLGTTSAVSGHGRAEKIILKLYSFAANTLNYLIVAAAMGISANRDVSHDSFMCTQHDKGICSDISTGRILEPVVNVTTAIYSGKTIIS